MKRSLVFITILALAAAGSAACGGGDNGSATGPSAAPCRQAAEKGCGIAEDCGIGLTGDCVTQVTELIEDYGATDQQCSDGLSQVESASCAELQLLIDSFVGNVPAAVAGMVTGN